MGSTLEESSTSLSLYMREMVKTPLLTPQEEVALARRARRGDKKARERMILANLRLVVKIAMEYHHGALPLLDLINEGNIGLTKAVDRFDPAMGSKLSNYAGWWIKQAIYTALDKARVIELPHKAAAEIRRLARTRHELTPTLGREPSTEELANEMGLSLERTQTLIDAAQPTTSLEAPISKEAGGTAVYADLVPDTTQISADQQLEKSSRYAQLHALLRELDPREADILRYRFGLNSRSELTLEQLGKRYRVTRERIRQIEYKTLKLLRKKLEEADAPIKPKDTELHELLSSIKRTPQPHAATISLPLPKPQPKPKKRAKKKLGQLHRVTKARSLRRWAA